MKKICFLTALLCMTAPVWAQVPQQYMHWYTYFGNFRIHEKWAIHFDGQARIDEGLGQARQILLRPGLQYVFNPKMNLTLGYAYISSYVPALDAFAPEHRIWEQFIYRHRNDRYDMTHRFRLEQRFVAAKRRNGDGVVETADWQYGNRIRYFNRTLFPLKAKLTSELPFYLAAQNEVFINFANQQINPNAFDQNRLLLAIGVVHKNRTRYEIGYMNQFLNAFNANRRMNHILHFSVLQNLDFRRE